MIDVSGDLLPTLVLLVLSFMLTGFSLWTGGRLAPWFLQEAVKAPSLKSFFFSFEADAQFNRVRAAVCGLAMAVMLAMLLLVALAARMMGWSPAL
jgi:hypothetical protein